jgi:uncharacterized membrane protein YvlD (DUF360 family)
VTDTDTGPQDPPTAPGPRIGLAAYDVRDPYGTFRTIEPAPRPPRPAPARALLWPLRLFAVWLANLGALAVAGLVLTNVGPGDSFAYVTWATVFGLVNAGLRPAGGLWRGRYAPVLSLAGLPYAVNVLLVTLMIVVVPPFHTPDVLAIVEAAAVMWLANLVLRPLVWHGLPRTERHDPPR